MARFGPSFIIEERYLRNSIVLTFLFHLSGGGPRVSIVIRRHQPTSKIVFSKRLRISVGERLEISARNSGRFNNLIESINPHNSKHAIIHQILQTRHCQMYQCNDKFVDVSDESLRLFVWKIQKFSSRS